ncbi:hypothetical protein [Vibrio marisflavi]|uniref:Uncharacterized protein n=1 Tax=Vibrio marisflavi CECT 7928 TaxID=634439 RepID=A0ABM9A3I9_9VIBR|nr:hypothetical protein [Vibrio marisflavi]CAH0539313.1 hypothetical protein VMF7928_02053 [Vibrio marisflavi CECT 7928]
MKRLIFGLWAALFSASTWAAKVEIDEIKLRPDYGIDIVARVNEVDKNDKIVGVALNKVETWTVDYTLGSMISRVERFKVAGYDDYSQFRRSCDKSGDSKDGVKIRACRGKGEWKKRNNRLDIRIPGGHSLLGGQFIKGKNDLQANIGVVVTLSLLRDNPKKKVRFFGEVFQARQFYFPEESSPINTDSYLFPGYTHNYKTPVAITVSSDGKVGCLAKRKNASRFECLYNKKDDKPAQQPDYFASLISNIDDDNLKIMECGPESQFIEKQGVVNFQASDFQHAGLTGYESDLKDYWCNRMNNYIRKDEDVSSIYGEGWLLSVNPFTGKMECFSGKWNWCLNSSYANEKPKITSHRENKTVDQYTRYKPIHGCRYKNGLVRPCPESMKNIQSLAQLIESVNGEAL